MECGKNCSLAGTLYGPVKGTDASSPYQTLSLLSGWVGKDMKKNATGDMDVKCCASPVTSHNLEYISWNVGIEENSMYFLHSPKQTMLPKLSLTPFF